MLTKLFFNFSEVDCEFMSKLEIHVGVFFNSRGKL